jgi:hypothetical protein
MVTVVIGARKRIIDAVRPPRTLMVQAPLGKLVGNPYNIEQQVSCVRRALNLIDDQ